MVAADAGEQTESLGVRRGLSILGTERVSMRQDIL